MELSAATQTYNQLKAAVRQLEYNCAGQKACGTNCSLEIAATGKPMFVYSGQRWKRRLSGQLRGELQLRNLTLDS
jgi:hypothetical protein